MRNMKVDPLGCIMLGKDGVLRSFDGPTTRNVIDAVALSPIQIKDILDKFPWPQEMEDNHRGIDGRTVVNYQDLFHPSDELRPEKLSEEESKKRAAELAEHNRKILEKLELEEKDGTNVKGKAECGAACGTVISNYDLNPKFGYDKA